MEAKIEVAWAKRRAEEIAAEERQAGRMASVRPYDDETYCVRIADGKGAHGLAARYAGTVQ